MFLRHSTRNARQSLTPHRARRTGKRSYLLFSSPTSLKPRLIVQENTPDSRVHWLPVSWEISLHHCTRNSRQLLDPHRAHRTGKPAYFRFSSPKPLKPRLILAGKHARQLPVSWDIFLDHCTRNVRQLLDPHRAHRTGKPSYCGFSSPKPPKPRLIVQENTPRSPVHWLRKTNAIRQSTRHGS